MPGTLRGLRLMRDARGLSRRRLSEISGVPERTIEHAERDGRDPTTSTSLALATALGVSVEELAGQLDPDDPGI